MKKITFIVLVSALFLNCQKTSKDVKIDHENKFSFVFMTDIHVTTNSTPIGLMQAVDVNLRYT